MISDFQKELEELINKHSWENGSNTPDFILAQYMCASLAAFSHAVNDREQWYGRLNGKLEPSATDPASEHNTSQQASPEGGR